MQRAQGSRSTCARSELLDARVSVCPIRRRPIRVARRGRDVPGQLYAEADDTCKARGTDERYRNRE